MKASGLVGQKQKWNCTVPHVYFHTEIKIFPNRKQATCPDSFESDLHIQQWASLGLAAFSNMRLLIWVLYRVIYHQVQKTNLRVWNIVSQTSETCGGTRTEILFFLALIHKFQRRMAATTSEEKNSFDWSSQNKKKERERKRIFPTWR